MTERPHLSKSQIEMLARCEMQWEYRYSYGIKSPPGVAMVVGKGTHTGVEKNLQRKMDWGQPMELAEVQAVTRDATVRHWERDPPMIPEPDPEAKSKPITTVGEAVDVAVGLAAAHAEKLAPQLEPIALEQAFVIETPHLPFDVVGVVDIETPTHVRDTKTKAKAPSKDEAKRSIQLALYHLRSQLAGGTPKATALDFLVKTRDRKVITLEETPDEDDHRAFMRRLEMSAAAIQGGNFKPAWPDSWWCSARFCGYWDRCPFGAKKRVSVGLIDPARLTTRLIQLRKDDDTAEQGDVGE